MLLMLICPHTWLERLMPTRGYITSKLLILSISPVTKNVSKLDELWIIIKIHQLFYKLQTTCNTRRVICIILESWIYYQF